MSAPDTQAAAEEARRPAVLQPHERPGAWLPSEDLMRELGSQYTIVIVTHNMQQATRVSDRTAFFSVRTESDSDVRTGILVEYGTTQQIFEDPQDSRTQAYVTGRIG